MWHHRWIVVVAVVLGAFGSLEWSARQPALYEASTLLYLAAPDGTVDPFGRGGSAADLRRHVRRAAEFAASRPVRQRAVAITGGDEGPGAYDFSVEVEALDETDQLRISVTHPTPDGAVALANAVAIAHEDVTLERDRGRMQEVISELQTRRQLLRERSGELERQLAASPDDPSLQAEARAVAQQLTAIAVRIEELGVEAAVHEVVVLREGATRAAQVQPRPERLATAGALGGLFIAGAVAWGLNSYRHARLARRDPDERGGESSAGGGAGANALPTVAHGVRVLGEIPDLGEHGVVATGPKAAAIFGDAVDAILASPVDGSPVVVISSLEPVAGKTATSINLAVAAVHRGLEVVVVDADRAKRSLSRVSGYQRRDDNTTGAGAGSAAEHDHHRWTPVDGIEVGVVGELPGASKDPDGPQAVAAALAEARSSADLVIVDGPTIYDPSAKSLVMHSQGVVIVDASGVSVRRVVQVRRQLIEDAGGSLIGLIINYANPSRPTRFDNFSSNGENEVARPLGRDRAAAADGPAGTPQSGPQLLPETEERL